MGGLAKLIDMLPGANTKSMKGVDIEQSEKEFVHMEAIIRSMTKAERKNPTILNASRRKRISAGSGLPVSQINQLIKKYEDAKKMMKQFTMAPNFKRNKMFRGL